MSRRPVGGQTAPMPSRTRNVTAYFIAWTVSGLYLDGWSHGAAKPDTFFTPWHGVLYAGFLGGLVWSVYDTRRQGELAVVDRLNIAGVVVFGAGMVGDLIWHEAFGIEIGIEALVSPTHLMLMTGGLLLASGPLRSALAAHDEPVRPPWREFVAPLTSATATTALAAFFLAYLCAFQGESVDLAMQPAYRTGYVPDAALAHGMAIVLVTTLLLAVPTAVILHRWRPPTGALLALCSTIGFGQAALDGFGRSELVAGAIAAGLGAEIAVALRRAELATAAMALAAWPVWFIAVELSGPMTWNETVIGGAVIMAVLVGGLVQLLHPPAAAAQPSETLDMGAGAQ